MTDRKAKELGYIDVTFVNLTEQRERQERLYQIIRWTLIVLAGLAGFMLFPMLVMLDTGDDVFASLIEWGNVTLAVIALSTFGMTGVVAAFATHHITDKR